MDVRKGFVDLVGNTPLVRLNKVSDATGCEILGKCEFLNPGGTVKDRAALAIILDAEEKGLLRPGGTIVEGTAGNTGIGLALVGNARGYKTVIVIPETQSQEKMDMLRLVGADLRPVPAVPYKDPNNYVKLSGRLAEELAGPSPTARSGPTSSTMSPTGWATTGRPARRSGRRPTARSTPSPVPSVPAARWPASACSSRSAGPRCGSWRPTRWVRRSTTGTSTASSRRKAPRSARASARAGSRRTSRVLRSTMPSRSPTRRPCPTSSTSSSRRGWCSGSSSAINIAGAVRVAKQLGPGHTIVTILADYGTRYQSKLFNPAFLREKGLPVPAWLA